MRSVSGTPRLVGLVADDLTGACDGAAQFAAEGWRAHVLCNPDAEPEIAELEINGTVPSLLAVVTGVRAARMDEAAAGTADAVRRLAARGGERLYVKVDSTMRGSVAGQLQGALAGWAETHQGAIVVLCPAFPQEGRAVVGGVVRVDGIPLSRTSVATDPVTPVVESRLDRLVPGATAVALADLGSAEPPQAAGREADRVVFVDASTDADLSDVAAALVRLGPQGVAAGSAGLATTMARQWSAGRTRATAWVRPSGRILMGVSSVHPLARESVERLRKALAARGEDARPAVHVISTPVVRTDPAAIAADFGDQMAEQVARVPYDTLVLVGGDGAAAALNRVGATAIRVHTALAPGVPIGTILGGAAHGVRLVTRSGGFGHPESLVRLIDGLQSRPSIGKEHP